MRDPATIYEQEMVPSYFALIAAHVVRAGQPRPGDHVLDVACGIGIVARTIAPHVAPSGAVHDLDLSLAMLAVAQLYASQEGLAITWQEGRAEALPYADAVFDLVVCQHGLQFMSDRRDALREMRRVLRPGGRLVVTVTGPLEEQPFETRLNAIVEERVGIAPLRQPYALGHEQLLRAAFEGAGVEQLTIERVPIRSRYADPDGYLAMRIAAIVAAVPALQQLTASERERIVAEAHDAMAPVLRQFIEDDDVVMPFQIQIARALRAEVHPAHD
jgi:SAM-dependent methyltransferase